MNHYLSSASLKTLAKGQLLGKYGTVTGAMILMQLCTLPLSMAVSFLIGTDTVVGVLMYSIAYFLILLFMGLFLAGQTFIYLKAACGQKPEINDLFHCFKGDTSRVLQLQAVLSGVSILCSLPAMIVGVFTNQSLTLLGTDAVSAGMLPVNPTLFLIYVIFYLAGTIISIYVSLMLSQVFYLMLDFPEYTASQLLKMSIRLMKGSKGRLFYIQLSFLPLILLSFLSCGIALLWIYPYMQATYANFYLDLIKKKN